ncbi:MAG: UBP-type zinc finger domain-containing protein [Anaerolineae bacterium]|nr:MAG: UBP-type zinc finger domain-containing protein [Anaerolineae bacterium]
MKSIQQTVRDMVGNNDEQEVLCEHIASIKDVTPSSEGCEECLQIGDEWVHLRLCLTCGHVGCCDNSKNRHATKHYRSTSHPVIQSFEPGEDWIWCYVDRKLKK